MTYVFPQTAIRERHNRIAHTRALKDNGRVVWQQEEQENDSRLMKLEQILRTIAVMIRDYCDRVSVEIAGVPAGKTRR